MLIDAYGTTPDGLRPDGREPRHARGFVGTAAAWTAVCAGLLGIAPIVLPGVLPGVLTGVLPGVPFGGPRAPAAGTRPDPVASLATALALNVGVLTLLLARGLRRGERRSWRAALVLLPMGAAAQLAHRQSVFGTLVPLALLALLLRHRARFTAPPDRRSRWRALKNFVLLGSGSILLGLLLVGAHADRMDGAPSVAARLTHVLYGLLGVEGPLDHTGNASWTVAVCLGSLGLLTGVTTVHLALRPGGPDTRPTADDEHRLRALLDPHGGRDPLDRPGTRRDHRVVFSPSGRAAVRYRVVSGVMIADGDPVGAAEAWPGAIERFMDVARARSWTPAVTGCSPTGAEVWTRETGLDAQAPDEAAPEDRPPLGHAPADPHRTGRRPARVGRAPRCRRTRHRRGPGPDPGTAGVGA
ncbi:phosphatidylglycerol lysyltransferase domain-containing protein [Streptomyces uncialis]|uniref:phosphatidylglycerol lysyltransferase domain-containing protein n=1 Tax=Streptomyces uncialis TaxID=1048205 RepID=UPI003823E2B4